MITDAWVPWARWTLRALLYAIVAAVVLDSFLAHWGYNDTEPRFGFAKMITYEADAPFGHRVLVPMIVNAVTAITPPAVVEAIDRAATARPTVRREVGRRLEGPAVPGPERAFSAMHTRFGWADDHPVQRVILYGLLFWTLFALQWAIGWLTTAYYAVGPAPRDVAPAFAVLVLPLTFVQGGFWYDFPELLLVTLAVALSVRRKWLLYYVVFALAVLNKETAILLAGMTWILHRRTMPRRARWTHMAAQLLLASAILLTVRAVLGVSAAVSTERHLAGNLWYLRDPSSYFVFEDVYAPGIWLPVAFNVASMVGLCVLLAARWKSKPRSARELWIAGMVVLVPLFLVSGWRNEVRVFYLAFPALYLLAFHTVYGWYVGSVPVVSPVDPEGEVRVV